MHLGRWQLRRWSAHRPTSEDTGMICHAHPSLSEAMKEAALAVDKRALII